MTEKIMRENLLVIVQTLASAKGWSWSTASKHIHGQQAFFTRFFASDPEERISVRLDTYYSMLDRMRAIWPEDLAWPVTQPIAAPTRDNPQDQANLGTIIPSAHETATGGGKLSESCRSKPTKKKDASGSVSRSTRRPPADSRPSPTSATRRRKA